MSESFQSSTLFCSVEPAPMLAKVSVGSDLFKALQQYNNPTGYTMIGVLLFLLFLSRLLGPGKSKTTTGRMTGGAEKLSATCEALRQIKLVKDLQAYNQREDQLTAKMQEKQPIPELPPRPRHNQVTVWCGTPKWWGNRRFRGLGAVIQTMLGQMPTTFVPDAQRSILALGIPNSGKTFSTIDRIAESMMVQGLPILVYDKKGEQMKLMAPMAARYGYKVHVFAPGEPFSGTINLLDFIKSPLDAVMAGEIAAVINQVNLSNGKGDQFFKNSGDQLARALLQLVKAGKPEFADMATVYALLQLPDFVKRLDHAVREGKISTWVAASFQQFLATKEAEKTISGIMSTASLLFSSFINAALLQSFLGESTIPKRIEGKQIIIFKLDDERRSVIGPLLAATIHMYIVANLSTPRRDPIGILLDELPSLGKLPKLTQQLNEYRSNGAMFVMGVQSLEQLYDIYGENNGSAIAAAAATHFLFNTNNNKTAEAYSKRFGEKEVVVRNKSVSRSVGGPHPTRSTSWNESVQKVPLFTVDQLLRLSVGHCVLVNPGYRSGGEGSLPFRLKISIPKRDEKFAKECTGLWDTQVVHNLQKRVVIMSEDELTHQIELRKEWANELLPLSLEAGEEPQRGSVPKQAQTPNALNHLSRDGKQIAAPTLRRVHHSTQIS